MARKLSQADISAIDAAIEAGSEPKKSKSGMILTIPGARYKTLSSVSGELTSAGKYYYEKTAKEQPKDGFDPASKPTMRGAQEVVKMLDGKMMVLRSWDGVKRDWKFTRAGKAFYKNSPDKYIIRFHVVEIVVRSNKTMWAEKSILPSTATPLGEVEVPATWSQERQLEELKRRAREWLASLESWDIEDDSTPNLEAGTWKIVTAGGGTIKSIVAKENCDLEYDKQSITVHEDGEVDVEAVIHRPLRQAFPWDFGFKGVCPEALEPSDNKCVPLQLNAILEDLKMSKEWLEEAFDDIVQELYGGESNPYRIEGEDGFEVRDWREAGVTTAMVQAFAEKNTLAVHAFWGDRKILSFVPSEKQRTSLCLYIWGDHAFFVQDPHTKSTLARAQKRRIRITPETVLCVISKPSEPYLNWRDFEGDIEEGHFKHPDLAQLRVELHSKGICPKVGLSGLGQMSTLRVKECVIHQARREAAMCVFVAQEVARITGRTFEYFGESMASFAERAFTELCRPPARQYDAESFAVQLREKQGGVCASCGDVADSFEVDHILPRILGGSDELDNMQLICKECHSAKTTFEQQSRIEDTCPLMSRFALSTYEAFVKSPKPPQCVADMSPQCSQMAISVDVRRCRYNAFVHQDGWDLPVFSPVDEIKAATPGAIADYNWIEIHVGRRSPRQVFPYFGPGWYGSPTAAFLLDAGIATWGDFKLAFNATSRRPASFLAERLEALENLWWESAYLDGSDERLVAKRASVALLGIWGSRDRHLYRMITSSTPFDVTGAGPVRVSPTPGSPAEHGNVVFQDYVYKQSVLELTSMRPVHQRCLEEERLQLARAMLIVEKFAAAKTSKYLFSIRVDEVLCWVADKRFEDEITNMSYDKLHEVLPRGRTPRHQKASSSTAKVYKFNKVAEAIYPGGTLKFEEEAVRPAITWAGRWEVIEEPTEGADEFGQRIVDHVLSGRSCCVEGAAGTGKTEVLKKIEAALREAGLESAKICLTHCGARNSGVGGVTAHSFVSKHVLHGTFSGDVVLIDEISFMSLDLLAVLEHLRLKGTRLICFGDFLQFRPISNHWRGSLVDAGAFQDSDLYKSWSECTKFVLRRCRRSDGAHFEFCNRIRGLEISHGVQLALERYPPRSDTAKWNLTISHWKRKCLNGEMQRKLATQVDEKVWVADAEVPFHIFRGTELMGRNNDHRIITTGAFLDVLEVEGNKVKLIDLATEIEFTVSLDQVAKHTKLRHAMTLYSTQGRSLPGTIAVYDWNNPHFTPTSLYIALSRAKESDKIWMGAKRKWTYRQEYMFG